MASVDSTFAPQWKYDVFLSFRGEDTGKTFTDHLYTALDENGFYAFRDDEKHEKREEIAPEFLTAIEESKISILVFSKNYASSRWCLDELETIIKSMKKPGRMVMPVFYHVDPSEVRDQIGSCEVFLSHERDAEETKEKVNRWRAALREASNLVGWRLHNQYESQLIKEIITDILRRLNCELLQVDYDTVGMEFRLKKLLSLINLKLDKVLMIGINGISGIGKTTIAKAIYNKISYHFQSTIFLTNVGENSRGHHLNLPQFQQLLDDASIGTYGRTKNKRVLLVVDDVDRLSQVEYLVKLRDSFSLRSRIIFTTRDRHLLNVAKLDASFESKGLTHEEAIHLFSWHAFKQTFPKEDYVGLVNHVVGYVKGHPLALKVLAGDFLKVVCLLKGKMRNLFQQYLTVLGWAQKVEFKFFMICVLQQFQTISYTCMIYYNKWVKNLLMKIIPLSLGTEEIQKIQFTTADSWKLEGHESQLLSKSRKISKFPSMPALKILSLEGCKMLRSLPSSICELKCLECLWCSGCSNLEAFPEITEKMENLKELHLNETAIKELPSSIYHLTALEFLNLEHCKNLVSLPSGIKLEHLDLSFCNDLVSFPAINSQLCGLRFLGLSHCKRLQSHPELQSSIEYQKGFLGFVLCSVYVPLDAASGHESENTFDDISQNEYAHTSKNESEDEFENSPVDATRTCRLECKLTDQIGEVDFLAFGPTLCECYVNGGPSKQVWIRYYPKVKECGVYLIYARSDQHYNLLAESLDDAGSIVVESDSFDDAKLRSLPSSICELKCLEHQVFWLFKPREELESRSCLSCPKNDPFSYVTRGFLGFALCTVYVQLDAESCHEFEKQSENKFNDKSQKEYAHTPKNESDDEFESSPIDATYTYRLECKLTYQIGGVDFLAFAPPFVNATLMVIHPSKQKYLSNEWGHLTASFKGYHSGIPLKVKECGVHLIYA
ncbi:hypothetical protein AAG906_000517 [Vitis piasezkii]